MCKLILSCLSLVLALTPYASQAASPHVAEAGFGTVTGCVDEVFGVTTTETEALYFYSYVENCDIGTYWSTGGRIPLEAGDFRQKGLREAVLTKTYAADGHEVSLALTWTGEGEKREGTRGAAVTGSFIIDGVDRITGGTLSYGTLSKIHP